MALSDRTWWCVTARITGIVDGRTATKDDIARLMVGAGEEVQA